jgi:cysteinyl-tRNA synthetase
MKYLRETFDIHAGGADVIFPHCENVLAICRGATGKRPVNYWLQKPESIMALRCKKIKKFLTNLGIKISIYRLTKSAINPPERCSGCLSGNSFLY